MMQRLLISSFLLLLLFKNSLADERLLKVQKEISALDKNLTFEKLKRDDIKNRLNDIDHRINKVSLLIADNQSNINDKTLLLTT